MNGHLKHMNYALQAASAAQLTPAAFAPITEQFDNELARNKRIFDARQFRLKSGAVDHPTMKFSKRDLEQMWLKIAAEATQASRFSNSQRALDLWNTAAKCATNSRQLAFSHGQMSGIYYEQKNYVKAEPLALRAVFEYQNEETVSTNELGKALINVALLYQAMNRLQEAARYYELASLAIVPAS
jgi:tetratricopeptide (TPR) repeat protein